MATTSILRLLSPRTAARGAALVTKITRRAIHLFRDVPSLRAHRRELLLNGRTVGLVPTMGALHAGHLSLARQAAAENSDIFVSIYVNPTQFGLNEDLDSYPKTWESDLQLLRELDQELKRAVTAGSMPSSPQRRKSCTQRRRRTHRCPAWDHS